MLDLMTLTTPDFERFEAMLRETDPKELVSPAACTMAREIVATFAERPESMLLTTGEKELPGLVLSHKTSDRHLVRSTGSGWVDHFSTVSLVP